MSSFQHGVRLTYFHANIEAKLPFAGDRTVPQIRLLTIDLDDTLWEAGPVLVRAERAYYEWLQQHTLRITACYTIEDLQRRRPMREWRELRHDFTALRRVALLELMAKFSYPEHYAEQILEVFLDVRRQVTLFLDVPEHLAWLERAYCLVAMTNGNVDLRRTGVDHFFEFWLSQDIAVRRNRTRACLKS